MKIRVERDVLAEAVAWAARSLPARPPAPVLAGLLLKAEDGQLSLSSFDYEVSARVSVDAEVDEEGTVLVSGACSPTSPAPCPTGRWRFPQTVYGRPWSAVPRGSHSTPCLWRSTRHCRRCRTRPAPSPARSSPPPCPRWPSPPIDE